MHGGRDDASAAPVSRLLPSRFVSHPLALLAAEALRRDAAALGSRWEQQARAVAPRLHDPAADARATAEPEAAGAAPARGERLVLAVAHALVDGVGAQQALVRAGWELGASSHGGEQSLHYLLKELNLLSAMVLYACERALGEEEGAAEALRAPAAEGMLVARRVQRAVSLLTLAASKGFTHDYLTGMRDHYRTLRHDLRNPLGTIRSAITLMEDEAVAPEMRNDPRFRAMIVRNASGMDRLIGGQLSDDSILGPALARQSVSLYEVAREVRRELRDDATARGCTIEVDESLPERRLDPVGLELALRALVTEAMEVTTPGSRVHIGFDGSVDGKACICITIIGEALPDGATPLAPELLADIAQWSGGKAVGTRGSAKLEFPARDTSRPAPASPAPTAARTPQDSTTGQGR
jgi:signal transduction histidine kinase